MQAMTCNRHIEALLVFSFQFHTEALVNNFSVWLHNQSRFTLPTTAPSSFRYPKHIQHRSTQERQWKDMQRYTISPIPIFVDVTVQLNQPTKCSSMGCSAQAGSTDATKIQKQKLYEWMCCADAEIVATRNSVTFSNLRTTRSRAIGKGEALAPFRFLEIRPRPTKNRSVQLYY